MQPSKPSVIMDNLLQHQSLQRVLSANVSLGSATAWDGLGVPTEYKQDNGEGILIRTTFLIPNTNQFIEHNLGRVPNGYIVTRKYAACDVYDDGTNFGWDTTEIALKCTVATDVVIYIF